MKNLIPMWNYLARAYEIALLGDFSITLYANNEYPNAAEDYQLIKDFYKEVRFQDKGDLLIELCEPDPKSFLQQGGCETLSDIHERVEKTRQHPQPSEDISESGVTLLQTAITKLNLPLRTVEKIKKKAKIIAWLGKAKSIQAEHIAEAIQSSYISEDDGYNLSAHTKRFSDGIQISMFDIEEEQIKEAIKYLQSRLN